MINWLTDYIGTGAYLKVKETAEDVHIVDVRGMVDKDGNNHADILQRINEITDLIQAGERVVVCCDYGMSRSNSIAAGVISRIEKMSLAGAVKKIQSKVSENGIKLEVLDAVFNALKHGQDPVAANNEERLLVTGGSGFIGVPLVEKLKQKYFTTTVSSREIDLIHNPVLLDVFVKENRITQVIHLANPRVYTSNNAMGDSLVMLRNVLDICRLNQCKLLYLSGWEVYSGYAGELTADENLPVLPKGAYGEAKWLAEELIGHYTRCYGIRSLMLRSSPMYGPNAQKPKFIYNFLDRAAGNEEIVTHAYRNGYPKLDLLHIDDAMQAIALAVDHQETGIFNIGSGQLLTTHEIAEMIVREMGSTSKISSTQIDNVYANIAMDHSKATRVLGWKPEKKFPDFISAVCSKP